MIPMAHKETDVACLYFLQVLVVWGEEGKLQAEQDVETIAVHPQPPRKTSSSEPHQCFSLDILEVI